MTNPSFFDIGRTIGNNFGDVQKVRKDKDAIGKILQEAQQTGNFQDAVMNIQKSVSPEAQQGAMQALKFGYDQQQAVKESAGKAQAAKEGGYNQYDPPAVAAARVKDAAKAKRLASVYGEQESGQAPLQQPAGQPTSQASPQAAPSIRRPLSGLSHEELVARTGHPDKEVSEPAKEELKYQDTERKENRADIRDKNKETLDFRKDLVSRAESSKMSIRNKQRQLDLIDKGDINDPSFATLMDEIVPFNLGRRFLSPDTVEYKGALVDDYSDLKNVFKGATRVKEVEIYEDKLADIYLTDEQKKAILKARMNTAKVDIARQEAAAEVEEEFPNLSLLAFSKKVEEKLQPKLDSIFNEIWDDGKAVLDQAERRKGQPLDKNDPVDLQIMQQIMNESGGDKKKAYQTALKKGYKFK